jgi:hypothetical protein
VSRREVGSEILTVMTMKSAVFWVVMSYNVKKAWYFGGTCCFPLQGWKVSQARNQQEAGSRQCCLIPASCWNRAWPILCPWRWRWYVPPNVRLFQITRCYNSEYCTLQKVSTLNVTTLIEDWWQLFPLKSGQLFDRLCASELSNYKMLQKYIFIKQTKEKQ